MLIAYLAQLLVVHGSSQFWKLHVAARNGVRLPDLYRGAHVQLSGHTCHQGEALREEATPCHHVQLMVLHRKWWGALPPASWWSHMNYMSQQGGRKAAGSIIQGFLLVACTSWELHMSMRYRQARLVPLLATMCRS